MSEPMIPLSQVLVYEVAKIGAHRQRREASYVKVSRAQNPARTILASIRQVVNAPSTPHIRQVFCT